MTLRLGAAFLWTAALLAAATPQPPKLRYPSPDEMTLSPDGKRLYVVCTGTNEVVSVDPAARAVVARAAVGLVPRGLALSPDGSRLYVANSWSDSVTEVDAQSFKVLRTLPAGYEPTGLALDARHGVLYVANRLGDDVSVVDLASAVDERRLAAGKGSSYVTLSPDGSRAFVTHIYPNPGGFRSEPESEITEIDTAHRIVAARIALHSSAGVFHTAFSRDGRLGMVPELRPKNLIPLAHVEHAWVFSDAIALFGDDIGGVVHLPLDEIDTFFSLPFGIAISPDKSKAYVSASGSNQVAALDLQKAIAVARSPQAPQLLYNLATAARYVTARITVGRNPRTLVLSLDGGTLYVANRVDDTISIVDTARMAVTGAIPLGAPAELTAERRGERLFYSSHYSFGHSFGCANCHLDSTFDKLSWDLEPDGFGVDIVDNRSLEEVENTAPFKWNGTNPDLQTECGPRTERFFFRSQGFRGDDLEDLVKYIKSIALRPNRYRLPNGELSASQERGKAVFERTRRKDGSLIPDSLQCPACHGGRYYTSQFSADVGTGKPTDRSPMVDIPQLTNVVYTSPYLHDGSARTLEEIWTVFNPDDRHGVTNDLAKDELNDLIEFLKTL